MDYLIRRIISEKLNNNFVDNRANSQCLLKHDISFLNFNLKKCCLKSSDKENKTIDILAEIFIMSLSHTLTFSQNIKEEYIRDILKELESDSVKIFYNTLSEFCESLISNKKTILLNKINIINNYMPFDNDIITDNIIYEIKCTKEKNSIYSILQLLGYSALINYNNTDDIKLNTMSVINLLHGDLYIYDISTFDKNDFIKYLGFLGVWGIDSFLY